MLAVSTLSFDLTKNFNELAKVHFETFHVFSIHVL
jgi:hypothetical protein